jgi:hypothetical protein
MRDKPVYGEGFISGNSPNHLAADVREEFHFRIRAPVRLAAVTSCTSLLPYNTLRSSNTSWPRAEHGSMLVNNKIYLIS